MCVFHEKTSLSFYFRITIIAEDVGISQTVLVPPSVFPKQWVKVLI